MKNAKYENKYSRKTIMKSKITSTKVHHDYNQLQWNVNCFPVIYYLNSNTCNSASNGHSASTKWMDKLPLYSLFNNISARSRHWQLGNERNLFNGGEIPKPVGFERGTASTESLPYRRRYQTPVASRNDSCVYLAFLKPKIYYIHI